MILNRINGIVLRQFYLYNKNFPRLMSLFVWVILDIILWGFMTRYLKDVSASPYNYVTAILGAVLLWDFLIRVMHGLSMCFMEDSWSRNLFNIFASPMTMGEYLSGLVVSSLLTSLLALSLMLILATAFFGMSIFAYGILILPYLLILFMTGIALGIMGAAIMLRFGPASEWLIWPIPAMISPFIGVFYPLTVLPLPMQIIAKVIPPSYVFENIRGIVGGNRVPIEGLFYGLGLSVIYIALACVLFRSVHTYALKTGLIARYSSESVS